MSTRGHGHQRHPWELGSSGIENQQGTYAYKGDSAGEPKSGACVWSATVQESAQLEASDGCPAPRDSPLGHKTEA